MSTKNFENMVDKNDITFSKGAVVSFGADTATMAEVAKRQLSNIGNQKGSGFSLGA